MTMEPMSEPEQVELLTGPEAEGLLVAALGTEGATISSWSVHSLHHRPGEGVSVGYSLAVRTAGGANASQYVCATTSRTRTAMRLHRRRFARTGSTPRTRPL